MNIATIEADVGETLDGALKRIAALEQVLLPLAALAFPSISPLVPAVQDATGIADKIVTALDLDNHASGIASYAAIVAPAEQPAPAMTPAERFAAMTPAQQAAAMAAVTGA